MSDNILKLHPLFPHAGIENRAKFIQGLQEFGFIGDEFDYYGRPHFRMGSKFFAFIDFSYSQPTIVLGDTENGIDEVDRVDSKTTCHIHVSEMSNSPNFLGGANTQSPLCRNCTYEFKDIRDFVGKWFDAEGDFTIECPYCGANL